MSAADNLPEPDRLDGAPHPREAVDLVGQDAAEQELLAAFRSASMHHAWVLAGPEGIGKATLAYRMARFVLAHPDPAAPEVKAAASLAVDPDAPAARQIVQMAHPDLLVLRRGWVPERKTVSAEIRVADVRRVGQFFGSTAGQGGWRVCIVDAADDLNASGANALLKTLEEPPSRSLFLIVSSAPRRLLPTMRSRCRMMPMRRLSAADVARAVRLAGLAPDDETLERAAEAADGSVRRALELIEGDAVDLRAAAERVLAAWPRFDWRAVHTLAEQAGGRDGEAFAVVVEIVLDWLHAGARAAASGEGRGRLAAWPDLWEKTARTARDADTFNLDRKPLVLNMFADLAALRG